MLVLESRVRRSEACASVGAHLNALAFRPNDYLLRILRIDDQRIDDPVSRTHPLEILLVHRLPQSTCRAGKKHGGICGILPDQLRAAERRGDALVFHPLHSAIGAVVDSRARRGMHVLRVCWVHDNAHHVGVINHALHDRDQSLPPLAVFRGR